MIIARSVIKNPYPGLRPFEESDSDLFFGRETQTDELLRRLGRSRFLAVIGTSGSGKSSLVRAGLLPALNGGMLTTAGSHWRIAVLRPGGDPIESLASALGPALYPNPLEGLGDGAMLETTLRRSSLGLVEAVRQARLPDHENLLVVVDQFEELFRFRQTVAMSSELDPAANLVHLILEAARQSKIPIYVLITMRSDFLGDCARFRDLSETINDGLYLIPRMTRDQLRLAITAPAAVNGVSMTPRLVQQLLNDVNDDPDQLPVLQHALMRTWNQWQNAVTGSHSIDLVEYEATGGMAESLSRHANEAWEELSDDISGPNKELAKKMFQCLTEKGPDNREVRRPKHLRDLCRILAAEEDVVRGVIERFREAERAFLMPPQGTPLKEYSVIDISHESLIRKWDKLRGWVEEEAESAARYREIVHAARLNERGEAGLWQYPQLHLALGWRSRTGPTYEWAEQYEPGLATAMAFLDRSVREQEKQKKNDRLRKWGFGLAAVAVIVAAAALGLYLHLKVLLGEAVSQRLATLATLMNHENSTAVEQSLLLATESMKQNPSEQNDQALRIELGLLPKMISRWPYKGEVTNEVAFSRDGRYVAMGNKVGEAGMVRVREARTGREIFGLKQKGGQVLAVAFTPDMRSQYLATGNADGTARVIEVATGNEISQLRHDGEVSAITFSPNGRYIATASADGTARVMEVTTGLQVAKLVHGGHVNTVAFSPDGRNVATGSDDGTLRLMEAATGKELWSFHDQQPVYRVVLSPDGQLVAAGMGDKDGPGFLRVLGAANGISVSLASQERRVNAVAFSPDGKYVATGGLDNAVRMFRLDLLGEVWRREFQQQVLSVRFSPDGKHLATASADYTARVMEVETGKEIARLPHQGVVNSIAFSPDSELVATGCQDGTTRVVESSAIKEILHLHVDKELLTATAFSPDQRYVATGDKAGVVKVTEIGTGKKTGSSVYPGAVYLLAFSRNGRYLAGADNVKADSTVRVTDLVTSRDMWSMRHKETVNAIAMSSDGQLVIIGGEDRRVRLIEAHQGSEVTSFPQQAGISALAVSLDGKQIAIGGDDSSVHIVDPKGRELLRLPPHDKKEQIDIMVFSRDGRNLAITSGATMRVIDAAAGRDVLTRAYPKQIYSAVFSADGQFVAVGQGDGMVRVIKAAKDQVVSAVPHGGVVYGLAFSTVNGRESLLVLSGDTVYADLLLPEDLRNEACSRLSRNLTIQEWNRYIPEQTPDKTCPNLPEPQSQPQ
jgi:WD40 repeat protein